MTSVQRFMTQKAKFILGALAVLGLLIALAGAGSSFEDVRRVGLQTGVASLLLMTLAVVGVAAIWVGLVSWLSPAGVWRGRVFRSFLLTWPARYVPGTLPYHAGRVMAAEASGSTRAVVVAAIAYEAILQVGAAALLGVLGIVIAVGVEESASSVYFIALAPLITLPVLLQPTVLLPTANFFLRLAKRQVLRPANVLTAGQTARTLLGYASAYVLNGVAFYLILAAMAETNPNLVLTVGAYSLAGAAGVLVLFVPSGMGVREAVIVAIMSTAMPAESVLLAAGLTRALSVIGDLVPLCLIALYEAAGRTIRLLTRLDSPATSDTP